MPKIKDLPNDRRPREKALAHGVETLDCSELLALVIGYGVSGYSALDIASRLLSDFHGLVSLSQAPLLSLCQIPGLNRAKALQLSAVFELGKRLEKAAFIASANTLDAAGVYARYHQGQASENVEQLVVLILNKKGAIIKEKILPSSGPDSLAIPKKELVVELLVNYASSYILAHNHPSGNPLPSEDDIKKTLQLAHETKDLGITLIDHIVMGNKGYYSFKESHLI